jgi:hypothetical protein
MTQHTSKRDHYDPFSDDVERCAVPVQGTLTIGTPKGISGPCPPEKIEPWDKVAVALAPRSRYVWRCAVQMSGY